MKTKLTHVRANVRDLQKALEWYETVLGFEVHTVYPKENPTYADFEEGTGACFSIMVDNNVPSYGRFNFEADDVERLWHELKGKVEVVEPLFTTPYGTTKFTIKDLDGNELGFTK